MRRAAAARFGPRARRPARGQVPIGRPGLVGGHALLVRRRGRGIRRAGVRPADFPRRGGDPPLRAVGDPDVGPARQLVHADVGLPVRSHGHRLRRGARQRPELPTGRPRRPGLPPPLGARLPRRQGRRPLVERRRALLPAPVRPVARHPGAALPGHRGGGDRGRGPLSAPPALLARGLRRRRRGRRGGFRYLIARSYGLHLGIDVARGPDQTIVCVVFGNAWFRP